MVGATASVVDRAEFAVLALLLLVGTVAGAASVGALAGVTGDLLHFGIPSSLLIAFVATLAVAADIGGGTKWLPYRRRQVSQVWWGRYPRPLVMLGWGFELGTGLLTHVVSAGLYVLLALAFALGTGAGLTVLTAFGLARGSQLLFLVTRRSRHTSAAPLRISALRSLEIAMSAGLALVGLVGSATWNALGARL